MKIIKINSLWCTSCIIMNERIEELKQKYNLDITELDYDFDEEKVKKYNPGNILPILIFLNDQNLEYDRLVGEHTLEELEQKLKEVSECL